MIGATTTPDYCIGVVTLSMYEETYIKQVQNKTKRDVDIRTDQYIE